MKDCKGIILAAGTGSRLFPLTFAVSKHLLPVYDKPMIFYPITTLILAGIKDILIIVNERDADSYKILLGDGTKWGVKFSYAIQPKPDGIAQAYLLAKDFLRGANSILILGDNLLFGSSMKRLLNNMVSIKNGASILACRVSNPWDYGVVELTEDGKVLGLEEKPQNPKSNYVVPGVYYADNSASKLVNSISPSKRGELEIVSVLDKYLQKGNLNAQRLERGYTWFDAGTYQSLLDAGNFVKTIFERQGLQLGAPEEAAYNAGYISKRELLSCARIYKKNSYGEYLDWLANSCES